MGRLPSVKGRHIGEMGRFVEARVRAISDFLVFDRKNTLEKASSLHWDRPLDRFGAEIERMDGPEALWEACGLGVCGVPACHTHVRIAEEKLSEPSSLHTPPAQIDRLPELTNPFLSVPSRHHAPRSAAPTTSAALPNHGRLGTGPAPAPAGRVRTAGPSDAAAQPTFPISCPTTLFVAPDFIIPHIEQQIHLYILPVPSSPDRRPVLKIK